MPACTDVSQASDLVVVVGAVVLTLYMPYLRLRCHTRDATPSNARTRECLVNMYDECNCAHMSRLARYKSEQPQVPPLCGDQQSAGQIKPVLFSAMRTVCRMCIFALAFIIQILHINMHAWTEC